MEIDTTEPLFHAQSGDKQTARQRHELGEIAQRGGSVSAVRLRLFCNSVVVGLHRRRRKAGIHCDNRLIYMAGP